MKLTAAKQVKEAGLKSLTQVEKITGQGPRTLANWAKDKPALFQTVLLGCVTELSKKDKKICLNCNFRSPSGYCQNDTKIFENNDSERTNDQLIYDYDNGGLFKVGDNFGCVHFTRINENVTNKSTRKNISRAIRKKTGYTVDLFKAEDYFFFYSEDLNTSIKINLSNSNQVLVVRLNQLSVEEWVEEFERVLKLNY